MEISKQLNKFALGYIAGKWDDLGQLQKLF